MRNEFENLLVAAKRVPNPTEPLLKAIKEAEKVLSQGQRRPEFAKLSKALEKENPSATIIFREDQSGLFVYTEHPGLLFKLAVIFGCPPKDSPKQDDAEFEAQDHWHGHGTVNLRQLANEIILMSGEFFCTEYKIKQIHELGAQ